MYLSIQSSHFRPCIIRENEYNMNIGGADVEYMTLKEASGKWGVTPRRINYYCSDGRVPGAEKKGTMWLIPANAEKTVDERFKSNRKVKNNG